MRILVVDDRPINVEVLRDFFEMAGWEVITAADGEEGINAFRQHDFDFVLTDLEMPKRDGLDVLAYVAQVRPWIKFALMTGKPDWCIEEINKGRLNMKDINILYKPLEFSKLFEVINGGT